METEMETELDKATRDLARMIRALHKALEDEGFSDADAAIIAGRAFSGACAPTASARAEVDRLESTTPRLNRAARRYRG